MERKKFYYRGAVYNRIGKLIGYGVHFDPDDGYTHTYKKPLTGLVVGCAFYAEMDDTTIKNWGDIDFSDRHPDAEKWKAEAKAGRMLSVKVQEAKQSRLDSIVKELQNLTNHCTQAQVNAIKLHIMNSF